MKAVVIHEFGGTDVLRYQTVEKPAIRSNQILVRVEKTSVNYADIKARYGKYHGFGKPPFIPGLDAVGIIDEVGSEVEKFTVGQRVIAFPKNGSYAEYIVVDKELAFVVPDNVEVDIAAACPVVSFTSYHLLANLAQLEKGETVVVHAAAGGIGTTAIQLAKILGAGCVIGTVGSKEKKTYAREAGADHVICYQEEPFDEIVNEITKGEGANVILDSIAGDLSARNMKCLSMYGRLVNFGSASGKPGQFKTTDLHSSCRSILGYSLGTTIHKRPLLLQETAKKVLTYLSEGKLKLNISQRFPLEEVAKAHELIEGRQSRGKIIFDVQN